MSFLHVIVLSHLAADQVDTQCQLPLPHLAKSYCRRAYYALDSQELPAT